MQTTGPQQLDKLAIGIDLTGTLDDVADGASYGRVALGALTGSEVNRIYDGSGTITGETLKNKTQFLDGTTGFITGGMKIDTGGVIKIGSATAYDTGVGTWIDENNNFRVGDPAAARFQRDDTNGFKVYNASNVAVFSAPISGTSTIGGWSVDGEDIFITNKILLKTSSGGERADNLIVLDASGSEGEITVGGKLQIDGAGDGTFRTNTDGNNRIELSGETISLIYDYTVDVVATIKPFVDASHSGGIVFIPDISASDGHNMEYSSVSALQLLWNKDGDANKAVASLIPRPIGNNGDSISFRYGSLGYPTWRVSQLGIITWGSGTGAATDVSLYRTAAAILRTGESFQIDDYLGVGIAPTNKARITLPLGTTDADGIAWGESGTICTLYRSAADTLKTDDEFVIGNAGGKDTLTIGVPATGTLPGITFTDSVAGVVELYKSGANMLSLDDEFIVNYAGGRNTMTIGTNGVGVETGITFRTENDGDATLYQNGSNSLKTDGSFYVSATLTAVSSVTTNGQFKMDEGTSSADGLLWGTDVNLYRSAANRLKTDDGFEIAQYNTGWGDGIRLSRPSYYWDIVQGGSQQLIFGYNSTQQITFLTTGNEIRFGSNTADVNLYRSAANILKTDDSFFIASTNKLYFGDTSTYWYSPSSNQIATGDRVHFSYETTNPSSSTYGVTFGGATAGNPDTNLYRDGAGILATDNEFRIFNNGGVNTLVLGVSTAGTNTGILFGGTAGDTNLYRSGVSNLKTDDTFTATAGLVTANRLTFDSGTTNADGLIWGTDTNLYRLTTNSLKTDDLFTATLGLKTSARLTFDAGTTNADGLIWGSDVTLYRSAANTLRTDDLFYCNSIGCTGTNFYIDNANTNGTVNLKCGIGGYMSFNYAITGSPNASFYDNTTPRMKIGAVINMVLPTNTIGLVSGDLWNSSNTVKIV